MTSTTVAESSGDLAAFVRTLRTAQKISLSGLADRAGIAKSTLSRWESGRSLPRLSELDITLDALDATPDQRRRALEMIGAPRATNRLRNEDRTAAVQADVDLMQAPMVGDLLRAMRQRKGRTVEEVARVLGVSARSVRAWEHSDAWPSNEHLHAFCHLLEAAPEEVRALTAGSGWTAFLPTLPTDSAPDALDALQEFRLQLLFSRSVMVRHGSHLKDLAYLALLSRLIPLAPRLPSARTELLSAYAAYANWLASQLRFQEAGNYAKLAVEMSPRTGATNPEWFRAVIVSAQATVKGGRHTSVSAAVRVANSLLESARPIAAEKRPDYEAWMISQQSDFAYINGQAEVAISHGFHAFHQALRTEDLAEIRQRRTDLAALLLNLNRGGEALAVIPEDEVTFDPGVRARFRLFRVRALRQIGSVAEAHDWLDKAYGTIREYNLDPTIADVLAQQF